MLRTGLAAADRTKPDKHLAAGVLMYGRSEPEYYEDLYARSRLSIVAAYKHALASDECRQRANREFNLCELEIVLKSGARKPSASNITAGTCKNPMTDARDGREVIGRSRRSSLAPTASTICCACSGQFESVPQVSALIAATLA